jgi:hypothetical protein
MSLQHPFFPPYTLLCCFPVITTPLFHWPFTVSVVADSKYIYFAIWRTWCNMTYFISNSPPISATLTKKSPPSLLAVKAATSRRETEFDAFKLGRLSSEMYNKGSPKETLQWNLSADIEAVYSFVKHLLWVITSLVRHKVSFQLVVSVSFIT